MQERQNVISNIIGQMRIEKNMSISLEQNMINIESQLTRGELSIQHAILFYSIELILVVLSIILILQGIINIKEK